MTISLSTVTIALRIIAAPLLVKAQETTQQPDSNISSSSSPSELNGGESSSSSFIGNKTKILIIVLSVVVGIVVVFAVAASILYAVAKRRQWALRDRMRHSTRRIVDTIKSPLTPRFLRSGNGHATQSSSSYAPKRQQQQQNRSSRGMTRIDDGDDNNDNVFAATQFVLTDNSDRVRDSKSREIERYPTWTDSGSLSNGTIQYKPTSAASDILGSKTSYFFDFSSNPAAPAACAAAAARGYNHNRKNDNDNNNNRKRSHKFRRQKKQDFDLERGIELGATDHMKVVISLSAKEENDEVKPVTTTTSKLRSWDSVFALGRR